MTPPNQQDVAALVARLKPVWQIIDAFMTVTGNDHLLRSDAIKALREAATALSTLAEERDALVQTSAELCGDCGWSMKFPDVGCVNCRFTASEGRATALEAQLARAREALERALIAPADYGDATIFARGRASLATEILTDLRSIPARADGRGDEIVNFGPSDAGRVLKARLNAERANSKTDLPTEARGDVSVKPLEWSAPAPPNDDCRYDHIVAATPWGPLQIEWKGWKADDSFAVYRDGFYLFTEPTLEAARASAWLHHETEVRSALTVPSSTAQTGDA